jgi:hypothetical protein
MRPDFPIDALISYHYFKDTSTAAKVMRLRRANITRFIGDSGAFSALSLGATIRLDDYATWCRTWWDDLCWCASLDVIGDPRASWTNWHTLKYDYQLPTVPTLHAGTGTDWLDAYAHEGVDLIGLGGMAGNGQAPRAFRWVLKMIRHARDHWPNIRFHLWGVTGGDFLETFPVWSADSSGLLVKAAKFGALRLFDPARGANRTVSLNGREIYQLGPLLRRTYGVDPRQIERSHAGNRELLILLQVVSAQLYAAHLQQRHQVTPPTMFRGATSDLRGPRLHIVDSNFEDLKHLLHDNGPDTTP